MRYKTVALLTPLVGLALLIGFSFRPPAQAQQPKEQNGQSEQKVSAAPTNKDSGEAKSMMQCPMMAGLEGIDLFPDSPEVLRSRAEALGLSDTQIEQLKKIEDSARLKARELLTDEQRSQLKESPERRLSMMELSRTTKKMQKDEDGAMCPMCMKMMQKMKQQSSEKAKE